MKVIIPETYHAHLIRNLYFHKKLNKKTAVQENISEWKKCAVK